jgi:hypothetical protein
MCHPHGTFHNQDAALPAMDAVGLTPFLRPDLRVRIIRPRSSGSQCKPAAQPGQSVMVEVHISDTHRPWTRSPAHSSIPWWRPSPLTDEKGSPPLSTTAET